MDIVKELLAARGIDENSFDDFLNPDYSKKHDPFLLPDMQKAVKRIQQAHKNQESMTIYGDYDVDGVTGTTLLLDALEKFGFKNLNHYLPDRFTDGYGINKNAIKKIANQGTTLIITVDCGSLNHQEITYAKELGVDVIVTDHHNVAPTKPDAVAVVNPKYQLAEHPDAYKNFVLIDRKKKLYPFLDLCGVGVAFKLVQALQTELPGLPDGQEKWLLDLVALGTVCDSVSLIDENRNNVYWGLKVMSKLHRPGIKALLAISGTTQDSITERTLGFGLGPRINAAGRLKTADEALTLLRAVDHKSSIIKADYLDKLNSQRRLEQDEITEIAKELANTHQGDQVLVLNHKDWNSGIIGIVASKIMEEFKKPTFLISEKGEESVGSARSFGEFSVADAIHYAHDHIVRGGGHKVAAGVTLKTDDIESFRKAVNQYYLSLGLADQEKWLLPNEDLSVQLSDLNINLAQSLKQLEPYGVANPEPVFYTENALIDSKRSMGDKGQHLKLQISQGNDELELVSFNAPKEFYLEPNTRINVWYKIGINQWRGKQTLTGMIEYLEISG